MTDYEDLVDRFTACANESVQFRLIRSSAEFESTPTDLPGQYNETRKQMDIESSSGVSQGRFSQLKPDTPFNPDMSHQMFGEKESIWGYHDLKIKLWFSAGSLKQYYKVEYTDKVNAEEHGIVAQNLEDKLMDQSCLLKDKFENVADFKTILDKDAETFEPVGEKVHEYTRVKNGETRKFIVTKANLARAGEKLLDYHERIQIFLLWFVDAASYIDDEDDKWDFYFLFEEYETGKFAIAGYATVYRFFAYPDKTRPRISQILTLPPFQRMGHGNELMELIYREYRVKNVVDMTVEDPSENFQRVRDFLDCCLLTSLPEFCKEKVLSRKKVSLAQIKIAREKFKINRLQCIRVFDILLFYLSEIDSSDEITREDCKKLMMTRMWDHYVRSKKLRELKRGLQQKGQSSDTSDEDKFKQMKEEAEAVLSEYDRVLLRFKREPLENWS